jgi:hypothetical protein
MMHARMLLLPSVSNLGSVKQIVSVETNLLLTILLYSFFFIALCFGLLAVSFGITCALLVPVSCFGLICAETNLL